jgi:hypothetical protein
MTTKDAVLSGLIGLATGVLGFFCLQGNFGDSRGNHQLSLEKDNMPRPPEGRQRLRPQVSGRERPIVSANQKDLEELIKSMPYSEWSPQLEEYVRDNPAACAAAINGITDEGVRFNALNLLLYLWGKQDYRAANAWANSVLTTAELPAFVGSLLSGLIAKDPEAAKVEVLAVDSPFIKQQLAASLAEALFNEDPVSAEAWVVQSLGSLQAAQILSNFGNMCISRGDMTGAIGFISKLPFGSARNSLIASLGNAYARQDVDAAHRWLETLDAAEQTIAGPAILAGWTAKDPRKAAEFVLAKGVAKENDLQSIVGAWAASSPEDALKWVSANFQNNKATGKKLTQEVVQQWGTFNPKGAADFVSRLESGSDKAHMLKLVTSNWLGRDPVDAGNFLTSLDWQDSVEAVELLVTGWTTLDSKAASEWVVGLDQGPFFDMASASLAKTVMDVDPHNAAKWASAISETNVRRDTLSVVFSKIGEVDPNSAYAILQQLNLFADDYKVAAAALSKKSSKR